MGKTYMYIMWKSLSAIPLLQQESMSPNVI